MLDVRFPRTSPIMSSLPPCCILDPLLHAGTTTVEQQAAVVQRRLTAQQAGTPQNPEDLEEENGDVTIQNLSLVDAMLARQHPIAEGPCSTPPPHGAVALQMHEVKHFGF